MVSEKAQETVEISRSCRMSTIFSCVLKNEYFWKLLQMHALDFFKI